MARVAQVIGVGRSSTLPPRLSSFVGRDVDLQLLHGLVAGHRLVTVLGPGGSGKTRVALELAGRLNNRFDGGVRLVELGAVSDPVQLPAIVAASLGLQEQPGLSATESLLQAVAG